MPSPAPKTPVAISVPPTNSQSIAATVAFVAIRPAHGITLLVIELGPDDSWPEQRQARSHADALATRSPQSLLSAPSKLQFSNATQPVVTATTSRCRNDTLTKRSPCTRAVPPGGT